MDTGGARPDKPRVRADSGATGAMTDARDPKRYPPAPKTGADQPEKGAINVTMERSRS